MATVTRQPALFPDLTPPIPANASVDAVERPRIHAQSERILERLRKGPARNIDLVKIALKYNARISEMRAAGHRITCYDRDRATGIAWYRLEARP